MTEKTKEFLNTLKVKGFWNNDYDYSEVNFTFQNSKVIVIDKKFNTKHLLLPKSLLKSNIKCTIGNCVDKTGYTDDEITIFSDSKNTVNQLQVQLLFVQSMGSLINHIQHIKLGLVVPNVEG